MIYDFIGKIVRSSNGYHSIVQISESRVGVGLYAVDIKTFNKQYKFIDEAVQKEWDEFYIALRAKKLLSSDNVEDEDDDDTQEDVSDRKVKVKKDASNKKMETMKELLDTLKEKEENDWNDVVYDEYAWKEVEKEVLKSYYG